MKMSKIEIKGVIIRATRTDWISRHMIRPQTQL